ncbi:MAG: Asp-tRNA(Asn)/Glu-tRNA(Gln) amidotransferase subunit GatB [Gemmatimonadota bacterium]
MALEPVIGLEVHVQLRTARKLFCGDSTRFGAEPNTNVCPLCLGLPGALPVVNGEAVELAVRAALGFGCEIHETSIFARKNYFYPDLPKGYQISQFDRPLATNGVFEIQGEDGPATIRIRRIHLEEDAGKSVHDRFDSATAVDLNRAGVPLVEIVSEPDLKTPADARVYLLGLKRLLEYLDISDCNMEEGSLRVDANVSVRPVGTDALNTKTELKNLNTFSGVEKALNREIVRQMEVVRAGGTVAHMTLLWDAARGEVRPMRAKEESHDYRYFPEPDLPPLVVTDALVESVRAELPEFPEARRTRFIEAYGLPAYDAEVLTASRPVADFYEAVALLLPDPKVAANWVMGPVLQEANERGVTLAHFPVSPEGLAELVKLVENGTVSGSIGKKVLAKMIESGQRAPQIVAAEGLAQVSDVDRLEVWVLEAIEENAEEAERYREGEKKLVGFFMGQVMRKSGGKADPKRVGTLLAEWAAGK